MVSIGIYFYNRLGFIYAYLIIITSMGIAIATFIYIPREIILDVSTLILLMLVNLGLLVYIFIFHVYLIRHKLILRSNA